MATVAALYRYPVKSMQGGPNPRSPSAPTASTATGAGPCSTGPPAAS